MRSTGIPFTPKQFFQVFEKYNQTIFPMQFLLILVAIASFYCGNVVLWVLFWEY